MSASAASYAKEMAGTYVHGNKVPNKEIDKERPVGNKIKFRGEMPLDSSVI